MRPVSLILTTLLLCVLCSLVFSQNIYNSKRCCFDYKMKISPKVVRYERTDQDCAMDAVIFFKKSGKKVCVDPKKPWVQHIMQRLDKAAFTKPK